MFERSVGLAVLDLMPILGCIVLFKINELPLTANVKIIFHCQANMYWKCHRGSFLQAWCFLVLDVCVATGYSWSVWLQLNSAMYGLPFHSLLYFVIELFPPLHADKKKKSTSRIKFQLMAVS